MPSLPRDPLDRLADAEQRLADVEHELSSRRRRGAEWTAVRELFPARTVERTTQEGGPTSTSTTTTTGYPRWAGLPGGQTTVILPIVTQTVDGEVDGHSRETDRWLAAQVDAISRIGWLPPDVDVWVAHDRSRYLIVEGPAHLHGVSTVAIQRAAWNGVSWELAKGLVVIHREDSPGFYKPQLYGDGTPVQMPFYNSDPDHDLDGPGVFLTAHLQPDNRWVFFAPGSTTTSTSTSSTSTTSTSSTSTTSTSSTSTTSTSSTSTTSTSSTSSTSTSSTSTTSTSSTSTTSSTTTTSDPCGASWCVWMCNQELEWELYVDCQNSCSCPSLPPGAVCDSWGKMYVFYCSGSSTTTSTSTTTTTTSTTSTSSTSSTSTTSTTSTTTTSTTSSTTTTTGACTGGECWYECQSGSWVQIDNTCGSVGCSCNAAPEGPCSEPNVTNVGCSAPSTTS